MYRNLPMALILALAGAWGFTLPTRATAQMRVSVGPHQEIEWSRGPASAPEGERPPNIVLILADDLGWNDLTFAGGGVAGGTVPTPHIDSIGRHGVCFEHGYAACGTCAPSRAAIMTGRYPTRFGFEFTPTPPGMLPMVARMVEQTLAAQGEAALPLYTYFDERESVPFDAMGMPNSEITLAEALRDTGYHTVHIGKWHLGRTNGMGPVDQGFDESLLMHSGLYLPENDPGVVNSKQDFDPIDRFLWMGMQYAASFNSGEPFEPGGYITEYYTDEAIKVIEANRNRPFFLYLAHWAPHTPLQALKSDYEALSHLDDHIERVYAAMIRSLDREVGRVLDALEANGVADNTLVIFTSDNGGAGYVGLPAVNKPYRGWKITFFEGGIRVPFFARWPERIKPGTHFAAPVHHFDILPTALAAAGADLPADRTIDGRNLLPYVAPDAEGALLTGEPHQRLFWRSGHYQVVFADGWKLQRTERPDRIWLFNLRDDPTERHNLAEQEPDRVRELIAMLEAHNVEQAEPLWPSLLEAPQRVDKTLRDTPEVGDEYVYWPN
jgi:arylsulfatase A-like enzyme